MAFTATRQSDGPIPDGNNAKEIWRYSNTGGSSGGVITATWLKTIDLVVGAYLDRTISTNQVTLTTNTNSTGEVELFGRV